MLLHLYEHGGNDNVPHFIRPSLVPSSAEAKSKRIAAIIIGGFHLSDWPRHISFLSWLKDIPTLLKFISDASKCLWYLSKWNTTVRTHYTSTNVIQTAHYTLYNGDQEHCTAVYELAECCIWSSRLPCCVFCICMLTRKWWPPIHGGL